MNALTSFDDSARDEIPGGTDEMFGKIAAESSVTKSLRILLVDDESSIRQHLKEYLTMTGNIVETAVDGVHGLQRFTTDTWDVVLVDYAMPRMNGLELALAIKERSPETPVILISGVPGLSAKDEDHKLPIDAFVPKPFTEAHLREALAKAARRRPGT